MTRRVLPNRRHCDHFPLQFAGAEFVASLGYYEDGAVAEVFLTGAKAGSDAQAISRDASIILSIALQYGVPVDVIRHALSRNDRGEPSSIIGALVDRMVESV